MSVAPSGQHKVMRRAANGSLEPISDNRPGRSVRRPFAGAATYPVHSGPSVRLREPSRSITRPVIRHGREVEAGSYSRLSDRPGLQALGQMTDFGERATAVFRQLLPKIDCSGLAQQYATGENDVTLTAAPTL